MTHINQQIAFLQKKENSHLLKGITRGVEKESLRVTPDGHLAQTPHPRALGSALTHPCITTDYSEALLEFITNPSTSVNDVLQELEDIHSYVYRNIGNELLWVNSMPCILGQDSDIPVAQYGSSNIGKMKYIYRMGLGHRYGRLMQTIAGIHYNFSLPDEFWQALKGKAHSPLSLMDFKTEGYFALIRNFRRHLWLLLYLFGSAPAVCRSFVKNRTHKLEPLGNDSNTLHAPFGTSLRMGDLGYQSQAQQDLTVCYNSLPTYIETLSKALTIPYTPYSRIKEQGPYAQLNANLLQIENEFYSTIRPKRTAGSGEPPLLALRDRGVEYIEVRCLDLDPFSPVGITAELMYFMDTFLLYCLLQESPFSTEEEYRNIQANQQIAVYQGRDPGLKLAANGEDRALTEWADALFIELEQVARLLDAHNGHTNHSRAVSEFHKRIREPQLTPSAKMLEVMTTGGKSYFQLALEQSEQHRQYFMGRPLSSNKVEAFQAMAKKSLADQATAEVEDQLPLDAFLEHYFQQYQQLNPALHIPSISQAGNL